MRVYPSTYKDLSAISVESERVVAQFLPDSGGKMASLIYKPRDLELLVQRPGQAYLRQPYDGDYVAGECSGLDDMFPTIDECFYERHPWKGTRIPDHGEVWSLPWSVSATESDVHFAVHGVRLPYRLEKRVSFRGEDRLHIAYALTNLSGFDLDFVWAAHIMLNLEEGAELWLPQGTEQVVTVLSLDGQSGSHGDVSDWPVARFASGETLDLSRPRPKSARGFAKYWVKGKVAEGSCGLSYPSSRVRLDVTFPAEQVPYLAFLPNEGGWQDLYNMFLEPATGSFDRIDVARLRGECSTLPANGRYEWYLELVVNDL